MNKKRIPKKDRAFLYFRENGKGYLNIKFGPDKYSHDTEKFYEILITGLLQSVTFLSNISKELPIEKRKENYETLRLAFQAILFEAFPDIKKIIEDEMEIDQMVEEAVESGEKIEVPDEEIFKEQIKQAKEKYKKDAVNPSNIEKLEEDYLKLNETRKFLEDLILRLHSGNYVKVKDKKYLLGLLDGQRKEINLLIHETEKLFPDSYFKSKGD